MRRVVTSALLVALAASVPVPLVTAGTAAASEAKSTLDGRHKAKGRNAAPRVPATGSTARR